MTLERSGASASGVAEPPAVAPARSFAARLASQTWGAVLEFFAFCRRQPLWTICMAVFVLTWTIELYLVQALTLVFPTEISDSFAFFAPKIRFTLDFLFVATITVLLRRRWLVFVVVGTFFVHLLLMTYFKYFHRPLTLATILNTYYEASQLTGFAWDMFPRGALLALLAALAVKITALVLSRRASLPRPSAWVVGLLLGSVLLGLHALATYKDPLHFILTTRNVGRLGYIRGYVVPWMAEAWYLRSDKLREHAIKRSRDVYDRIAPLEADIPLRKRIVMIQAESLDGNILGYHAGDVEVTPFLNHLRKVSMYYRVVAMHTNGSSDADFVALTGSPGSPHVNPYKVPDFPYENTLPQLLAQRGYQTHSYHGNSGQFYDRNYAFNKIGFAQRNFREQLERDYGLKADRWGVLDEDVLRVAVQDLRAAQDPTFHFIITLTTHTPYTILTPDRREIYPRPQSTAEHYINNMRYLDNCLRDYITALGNDVTVIIYADHPTEDFPDFVCDRDPSRGLEFIPVMIYDPGEDLSKLQKTRDAPASTDGSWNLADVANYIRAQVRRLPTVAEHKPAADVQPAAAAAGDTP